MPALRRRRTRRPVPRAAVRAQNLQLLELSAPRRCTTKVFLTRQTTLPLQVLHRAYTSELHGTFFIKKLLKPQPRRRHRGAHRAAHRWQPCDIGGIVEILRSENVRDDDVVEKAGDRVLRVGKARGSSDGHEIAAWGSHVGVRCVGGYVKDVVCASLCARGASRLPRKALLTQSNKILTTGSGRSNLFPR
jgi:hypothetical protein